MTTKKGFTLIETAVAIVIIGIGISAMLSAFIGVSRYVASARHHYRAASLVRDKAEEIMHSGVAVGEYAPASSSCVIDTGSSASGDELTGTMSVNYNPNPAGDDVTVTISVSWNEILGGNREETAVLYMLTS